MGRCVRLAVLVVGISLVASNAAVASREHPRVVRENPANFTPRLRADNAVGHPHMDAFSRSRGTVYAGGTFRTVSNAAATRTYRRHHVLAFDATTGAMRSFAPKVDGPIWAVQAVGKAVYLGGSFRHVNGVRRIGLAKVDARTGKVRRRFNADFPGGRVNEIRRVDGRLLVGGSFPQALVALRPRTGRNTGYLRLRVRGEISGSWGRTAVYRFAVSPDDNRLVAVGNFTTVSGKSRKRAFMVGLRDNRGRLARWYYRAFRKPCSSTDARRVAYLQDVDFSPRGGYFVVVSTGQISRRGDLGETVCDAAARFETDVRRPRRPTWINYTGGDSVWSVAATGAAVYVQGHFKWLDNARGYQDDPVATAVRRRGIGAINSRTGKALAWNPDKPARIGGKDMMATGSGLWVGSDSKRFNGEPRRGVAFAPL
ncbi:hypothetical protein BH20ACT6_BH20ACT6_20510 [soil metagenome]